jgi:hypothetical protein
MLERRFIMLRPFIRPAFSIAIAAAPLATGQTAQHNYPMPPKPHEHVGHPYLPPTDAGTSPPAVFSRGPGPGSQVNVNASGLNILNDAGNEPSICIDPTHPTHVAIGWRQFDNVGSNFRQAGFAYSRDSGRTWTFPGRLTPGNFRSDPVLGADADGTFYYCSLTGNFDVSFFKSLDGGRTYAAPTAAFGGDKQWFTIDRTGGPGDGHVYLCWSEFAGCCGTSVFTRSTNGAATFSTPQALPTGHVFGTLDVGSAGQLYLTGFDSSTLESIVLTRSSNAWNASQGVIFDLSTPLDIGGVIGFGDPNLNPDGLLGQVTVAVDRSGGATNGNVYLLASVDPPGPDPLDVRFARSTNGGVSFSPSIRLNTDPAGTNAYQWFGTMSVAPNGRIDVVWNDTRHAANPSLPNSTELFYTRSIDGGVTWQPEQAIGPAWNPFLGFPSQNKIGDYYDMRSDNVGASLAYAATYNGEQDVWFKRIGDYDCNGNGVGDLDDIAGGTSSDVNGNGNPDECECLGDMNGDGTINLADLASFLAAFGSCTGQPAFNAAADINADGCVTLNDLAVLLSNFGRNC